MKRIEVEGGFLNVKEDQGMVLGYTERGFRLARLGALFSPPRLVQLKQIHSDIILEAERIKSGSKGDGIVLGSRGEMAIIKTADCIPLFFWERTYSLGGILHIGWRGLLQGIETKLVGYLKQRALHLEDMVFFMGAGIDRDCYEVGEDLVTEFQHKGYADSIFSPGGRGKYLMDLKLGVRLSLRESGVPAENILDASICTFCTPDRLPSYRRGGNTNERIYNFLMLK